MHMNMQIYVHFLKLIYLVERGKDEIEVCHFHCIPRPTENIKIKKLNATSLKKNMKTNIFNVLILTFSIKLYKILQIF